MLDYIKIALRNASSIKIVFYIVGLLLSLPFAGMIYRVFDTTYLAAFGVGPEFYSRPIFSSSLINIWLFVSAIKPGIWIWMVLTVLIFFLFFIGYYNSGKKKEASDPESQVDVDTTTFLFKVESFFNVAFKAGPPALVFFFSGLAIISFATFAILFFSNDSSILAKKQIKAYIEKKQCMDAFNDFHLGCYTIPGETGNDHLLILNNKDVIIFMSREKQNGIAEEKFTVTVKNKVTQEKMVRLFNYIEKPKKSKE